MRAQSIRPRSVEVLHRPRTEVIEDQRISSTDAGELIAQKLLPNSGGRNRRIGDGKAWTQIVLIWRPEIGSVVVAPVQIKRHFTDAVGSPATASLRNASLVILRQRIGLANRSGELAGPYLCTARFGRSLQIGVTQPVRQSEGT